MIFMCSMIFLIFMISHGFPRIPMVSHAFPWFPNVWHASHPCIPSVTCVTGRRPSTSHGPLALRCTVLAPWGDGREHLSSLALLSKHKNQTRLGESLRGGGVPHQYTKKSQLPAMSGSIFLAKNSPTTSNRHHSFFDGKLCHQMSSKTTPLVNF